MLPWAEMLRSAVLAGLTPCAFWRLSLREWRWLSGEGTAGLGHADLRALMAKFPDKET